VQIESGNFRIEVDGGINATTAALAKKQGADTFVVGTAAFHAPDNGRRNSPGPHGVDSCADK
jgi:pentose-5-phosphate-3-epimerase